MVGMGRIRVYFSPVGCPKANVDLEKAVWAARAAGLEIVERPSLADFVVTFTCGFIDDAKQESIDDILTYADLKKQGVIKGVVVAGCLAEKYGDEIEIELPEVDVFVANTCLDLVPSALRDLDSGKAIARVLRRERFEERAVGAGGIPRCAASSNPWTRAVLICDGCNNACTYCAIPHMRGPLRSREIEDVIEETNALVAQGAKEIVLAGQDTASYGRDRGKGRLGDLMAAVAQETEAHWLRLAYANPENLEDDVAAVIRDHANICHYIDMPIQHASPRMLSRMGRRGSPESLIHVVANLRKHVHDIALRTSVIVGFPGETESEFQALLGFLSEIEFDMVGAFRFSPQPGTPAAALAGKVPQDVAEQRLIEVVSLQADIARSKTRALLGRALEILVETSGEGTARGRSQYDMGEVDRVIRLKGCTARPGEFIRARLEKHFASYELEAACL
jgi:ribosomal protein S12 methylthiotransferase